MSCGHRFYLSLVLVLGLWLDVCERCSAPAPMGIFLLVKQQEDSASSKKIEADRKAFDTLLQLKDKCTLDFFVQFERLTEGRTGNYDSAEENRHQQLKANLLAQCKATFVDDFASRVAGLSSDERKLLKLDHVIKTTDKYGVIFLKRGDDGQRMYAIMSVMGDAGVFASGAQLSEEELNVKYVELVEQPCASLRQKLEPAAELFRMYRLKGVDETFFNLASTSSICAELLSEQQRMYRYYTILLNDRQVPGDPASEAGKARFEARLKAVMAKKDDADKSARCSAEFFSRLDQVISDAGKFGMKSTERDELEMSRRLWFEECKDKFVQELEASIRTLDPVVAASMAELGETFYKNRRIIDMIRDLETAGADILTFLKEADSSIRDKKLDAGEEFTRAYNRLVVEPCKLLNSKLEPAVIIFRNYAFTLAGNVNEFNTNKTLMNWIGTSRLCRSITAYQPYAQDSYQRMAIKKASRLGRLFGCHRNKQQTKI